MTSNQPTPARFVRAQGSAPIERTTADKLTAIVCNISMVAGLGLAASVCTSGCAEVVPAAQAEAEKLANLRADKEEDAELSNMQQRKKAQARARGADADSLYDDAEPLRKSEEFQKVWVEKRKVVYERKVKDYIKRPGKTVAECIEKANGGAGPDVLDNCVSRTPPDESINPVKAAAIAVLSIIAGIAALMAFRSARRRIDTVAVASKNIGLTVVQGEQKTVASGKYKDQDVKIESSAPEMGQGDRFMRVIVQSNIGALVVVRFGPVAPPTGLDLPDLDAPEVADSRLPEGYKLRLSEGVKAEELLTGDIGFQLRVFDPVDVRIHDGVCGVTCWQVPATPDKVVEFIDLTLAVAKLYA